MARGSPAGGHPAQHFNSWRESLSGDLRAYWPLWLIVAVAVFLRIYEIGRLPGLIGDEAWYGVQAQRLLEEGGGISRTPTGNVPGLIQMGSLAILHALFEPSALLLRLPALLTSLAAMGMAYAIGRRFFGSQTAMAALVLMSALPINIAYARFGWDPSHAPLLVLAATYATLAGRRLLAALLFALALANHPAAVFVAPFLVLAHLGFELERQPLRTALAKTVIFCGLAALAVLLSLLLSPSASHYLDAARSIARLVSPQQWLEFAMGFCRLLSGDTVYSFIVGRGFGQWRPLIDAAVALLLAAALVGGLVAAVRGRDWCMGGMLVGWVASLLSLFVIAGPWVVRPVFERFSLPLVPLTVLLIAAVLGLYLAHGQRRIWFQPAVALLSLSLLAGFWTHYLQPLKRGENHPNAAYWIGLPGLNQAAADRIGASLDGRPATVVVEDGWIYWPVTYRLAANNVTLVNARRNPATALAPPRVDYWISYRGSVIDRRLARHSGAQLRWTIASRDGRDALNIWSRRPPE